MLKRCFHSSAASFGRKTGASAFVAGPRNLSKKQKKRNVNRLKARAAIIDQKKEKIKNRHSESQINSPEMITMITDMNKKLEGAFQDLLLPDGLDRLDHGEVRPKQIINKDPTVALYILRDLKAQHDLQQGRDSSALISSSEEPPAIAPLSSMQSIKHFDSPVPAAVLESGIRKPSILTDNQAQLALTGLASSGKFKELGEV